MKNPIKHTGLAALIFAAASSLILQACLLVDGDRPVTKPGDGVLGYVGLDLSLQKNRTALLKPATSDTIFELDSLFIVLTAADADTVTYSAAISGRADTGAIILSPLVFELPALRNWKARVYTVDINGSPARRDTVHNDSVVFGVHPADTVYVSKSVASAFSILRARFLSSVPDSVADKVLFLRLRVDGITRDSVMLGGSNATLRWIQALPGSTIFAAGDSGRILKSTSDAINNDAWTETVVSTQPLVGGHFPDATNGYIVSSGGQVFVTANGGTSWAQRTSTADSLNAAFFTSSSEGWAVGRGGGIYKTANSANSWYTTMISNTTQNLNGVHFPTPTVGFVVGENEIILRTTNGNGSDAPPAFGGVVWSPVAGGWFPQTSNTTANITDIKFVAPLWGWAVGPGYVRRTVNGGATWLERSGLNVSNPNAIWFSDSTNAYAVGNSGEISHYQSQWYWAPRTEFTGTTENLNDVRFVGNDTGYVVGNNGTILRTTNGTNTNWPYATWTKQSIPVPGEAWSTRTTGTLATLRGLHFSGAVGWAVGDSGRILMSADSGATWSRQTSGVTTAFNAVHVVNTSTAYAAGAGGVLRRTTNAGASWANVPTGINTEIRGVAAVSASVGWVVGASSVLSSTNQLGNASPSWTSRNVGSGTYNALSVTSGRVWVVGEAGQIRRSTNVNHNTGFSIAGNANVSARDLKDVYFTSADVGYVVGSGGLIAKTTNGATNNASNVTWTVQTSNTTVTLRTVDFVDANTGYVTGDSGVVLKTTNGGTSWTHVGNATTQPLNAVFPHSADIVVVAGGAGTVQRTLVGGVLPQVTSALRSVYTVTSTLAYVAGAGGTIAKTTNAGMNWAQQTSGTTNDLNGVSFVNANTGWAVGNSGTILKTTNGGANWTAQTSGTTEQLRSVQAVSTDTAYATGTSGIILKTVDGGAVWYQQETPVTQQMNRVFFLNGATGFAAGNSGTIINAVNRGDNWTGGGIKRSLKGVYFTSVSTGWIVGDDGVILKTTDTGSTWIEQHRQNGLQLYGVYFVNANTGWASGEGGVVLKTTNGGTTWTPQSSGTTVDLRWVNFRDANRGFIIGGTSSLLETSNGGGDWSGLFVGVPGEREFDELLTHKYLRPGQSQQVMLEAIDRFSLPLRGYQSVLNLTVGAGQDTTINAVMARCGHVDSLPCAP